MAVQTQIQTRRGTAASWTSTNPTLAAGEIGFETDTGKFKIGNGSTAWAALAYSAGATAVTYLFNATSGQTTFSGADANGLTLAYTVGAEQVYLNGVLQVRGSDYTATNGTSIVLASGALTSDVLNVIAYSAMTITDTYTQAQSDAKFYQILSNGAAGKNAVINGGMDIWQRGTSTSIPALTYPSFPADRWITSTNANQACTVSRQATGDTTNLPNIQYAVRYQRNSGQTGTGPLYLIQNFETATSIPFAGKTVTLSFYARKGANYSATSSILVSSIQTGTGTDQNAFSGYTGAVDTTQNNTLTTTWQRFTQTVTIAATTTEMCVYFLFNPTGTASTNDYYEVTGVQLELGSIATPFARAGGTIAGELAACQRYLPAIAAIAGELAAGQCYSGTASLIPITFPVTARTAPTGVTVSSAGAFRIRAANSSKLTVTALNFSTGTPQGSTLEAQVASGITAGNATTLFNESGGTILFTGCEL